LRQVQISQGNQIGMKQVENKPAQNSVPDCAGATFHSLTKHLQTSESTAVQMPPLHTFCYLYKFGCTCLQQTRMDKADGLGEQKPHDFFFWSVDCLSANPETSYELDH